MDNVPVIKIIITYKNKVISNIVNQRTHYYKIQSDKNKKIQFLITNFNPFNAYHIEMKNGYIYQFLL